MRQLQQKQAMQEVPKGRTRQTAHPILVQNEGTPTRLQLHPLSSGFEFVDIAGSWTFLSFASRKAEVRLILHVGRGHAVQFPWPFGSPPCSLRLVLSHVPAYGCMFGGSPWLGCLRGKPTGKKPSFWGGGHPYFVHP